MYCNLIMQVHLMGGNKDVGKYYFVNSPLMVRVFSNHQESTVSL